MASLGNCPICLDSLAGGEPVSRSSPCGHVAHSECFRKWEQQQHRLNNNDQNQNRKKVSCPTCKQPADGFEPLFVELVKSELMKELEKERDDLQKQLEEQTEKAVVATQCLEKQKKKEAEISRRLKASEQMNQALLSMDQSVKYFCSTSLKALEHCGSTTNTESIFAMVEKEIGMPLTVAMKQTISKMLDAQHMLLGGVGNETVTSNSNSGPAQVVVQGCGLSVVDGSYHQDGYFVYEGNKACMYSKLGVWDSTQGKFCIYGYPDQWYISFVARGCKAGNGTTDVDFYQANTNGEIVPPTEGWDMDQHGAKPSPTLRFVDTPAH